MTLFVAVVARDVAPGLVWLGIPRGCPLVADSINILDDVDGRCCSSTLEEGFHCVLHEYQVTVLWACQKKVFDVGGQVAEKHTHCCDVHVEVATTVDGVTGEGLLFCWRESGDAWHGEGGLKQIYVLMDERGQNFVKFDHI